MDASYGRVVRRRHSLPVFRFNKASGLARDVQAKKRELLRKRQEFRRFRDKQSPKIESKKRELARAKEELRGSTSPEEQKELKQRKKKLQQELSRLKNEFRAAKDATEGVPGGRAAPRAEDGSESGALPDFVIIGAKKCGTTTSYEPPRVSQICSSSTFTSFTR